MVNIGAMLPDNGPEEEVYEFKDSSTDISNQEGMKIEENISIWKEVKSKGRKNINQTMVFNPVEIYNRFDILENEISSVEDVENVIPEKKCETANMNKHTSFQIKQRQRK